MPDSTGSRPKPEQGRAGVLQVGRLDSKGCACALQPAGPHGHTLGVRGSCSPAESRALTDSTPQL